MMQTKNDLCKKQISDWAVTDLCRINNITKSKLYDAIMSGKLVATREPGTKSWCVSETDLKDFIEKRNASKI